MPKVRREGLPRPLYRHLLERVYRRAVSTDQLELLLEWLEGEPEVPQGRWFKRFPGMIVCGEGALVKTFLSASQTPIGEEVE